VVHEARDLKLLGTMTVINNFTGHDIGAIEKKIQVVVFSRRIRLKDAFRDFDPRRSWRCTKTQFIRALDTAGVKIAHAEAAAVADVYRDERTGDVQYGKFSDAMDECFGKKYLEGTPDAIPDEPGKNLKFGFQHNEMSEEDMQILAYAMHRVALLCKTRGINFKDCFRNYDKQTTCCVTEQQFRRCFPFEGFTEEEMDVLVNRYTDRSRSALNGINYQAFHDDVMEHDPAPIDPRSRSRISSSTRIALGGLQRTIPRRRKCRQRSSRSASASVSGFRTMIRCGKATQRHLKLVQSSTCA
jgi:hypothetical protein